jgi:hypothetical protein
MSKPSIQSHFLVFCGVVMLLSACSHSYSIEGKQEVPITRERSQILAVSDNQPSREDYKAIALAKLGKGDELKGSDPKAIALRLFGNTEPESGKLEISVETNFPRAVAIVTQTGIGDDSVHSIRYRAEFTATQNTVPPDQVWTLVWAGSQFKCQLGRGDQDWSTQLCS